MTASPGRGLTAPISAATQDRVVRIATFFELELTDGSPTEFTRVSDLPFTTDWGGRSWTGIGTFGSITRIEETTELKAPGIEATLNGIDPSLISLALSRHIQGDPATLYWGFYDSGHVLIDLPITIFRGRADVMRIVKGDTAAMKLSIESVLADWDRPRVRRYNNADQQQQNPGDKGFEFVEQLADKELNWPNRTFFSKPQFQ